jgi:hypothetical protein
MAQAARQWLARAWRAIDEQFWLRHSLFWLVRTVLLTWLLRGICIEPDARLALRATLLLLLSHMLATYTLLYGVLPALWRGQQLRLGLLVAGWLGLSLAINHGFRLFFIIPLYQDQPAAFADLHNAYATGPYLPLMVTAGVAASLWVYRRWQRQERDNAQLRQENYQAELQLLKAQIHPHFLFNTLNNLYALTLKQSDQAPAVVERLTGLLRFVVEQGSAPLVSLAEEVTLLRNYLALEQLRYGSRLTLEFQAEGIPATGRIAPLLLLPLVENAFKHGSAEQLGAAAIRIALAVAGPVFSCEITNTRSEAPAALTGAEGIGLRNVRQRLQLLYPQRHRFSIEATDRSFTVRLALQLPEPVATPPVAAAPAAAIAWAGPPRAVAAYSSLSSQLP